MGGLGDGKKGVYVNMAAMHMMRKASGGEFASLAWRGSLIRRESSSWAWVEQIVGVAGRRG